MRRARVEMEKRRAPSRGRLTSLGLRDPSSGQSLEELTHTPALRLYSTGSVHNAAPRAWETSPCPQIPTNEMRNAHRPTALEDFAARIPSDGPRIGVTAITP